MKLADYVINFLHSKGIDTAFIVVGGMAIHLDDSLSRSNIRTVFCHHEQACAYAAEGYGHITGKPALVLVTAGPGALNALSGILGAYTDSIPMIIISGQSKRMLTRRCYGFSHIRQIGEQEVDIIGMARSLTKYAQSILDPERIAFELGKAWQIATNDRPGPVWLEIPLDVQAYEINPEKLAGFPEVVTPPPDVHKTIRSILDRMQFALRPLVVIGPDVPPRLKPNMQIFLKQLGCPVIGAGVEDVIHNDSPFFKGRMGILGTRAGNIAIQNADIILFLGMRSHLGLVTYNWQNLGCNAHKIVLDDDPNEFERPNSIADEAIFCSLSQCLDCFIDESKSFKNKNLSAWMQQCNFCIQELNRFPQSFFRVDEMGRINPYWFAKEFISLLCDDDCIVASNASSSVIPLQVGHFSKKQIFFSNHGNGAMGFGLPAAIGASYAAPFRRIICFEGDGSIMMNIQEMQTIAFQKLPIIIVVFNNGGYLSIKQSQQSFFGYEYGASPYSGLGFPDFISIANSFGIEAIKIQGRNFIEDMKEALNNTGPLLLDVQLDPSQGFEPKVTSRFSSDGTVVSARPEDMSPFLEPEELAKFLIIQ